MKPAFTFLTLLVLTSATFGAEPKTEVLDAIKKLAGSSG
jgi:hypothetical protein